MSLEAVVAGMSMLCVSMLTSSELILALKGLLLGSVTGSFWVRRVIPLSLSSIASAGRRDLSELVDWSVKGVFEGVRRRVGSGPCGRSSAAVLVCKGLLCLFVTWLLRRANTSPGMARYVKSLYDVALFFHRVTIQREYMRVFPRKQSHVNLSRRQIFWLCGIEYLWIRPARSSRLLRRIGIF